MDTEKEVLARIVPSPGECAAIVETAEELRRITRDYFAARGIDVSVRYVGSVAKGTYLRDPDVDLFVMFPESVPKEDMERIGIEAGVDLISGRMMYAEHPYTTGSFRGLSVDLVPCYAVDSAEHLQTAVDRTPFHTDYILSHTDAAMRDEMRLTKAFMKGIGTYGAEPEIRGFSGYLCEILTLRFGGFRGLLKAASSWKEGTVAFLERKGPDMDAPLVFYDPVDPKRNVASAVHLDTMCRFIIAAREYLRSPDTRFFFPEPEEPLTRDAVRKEAEARGTRLMTVMFPNPGIIDENLQAQVWKSQYALWRRLGENGFGPVRAVHGHDAEKAVIIFEMERDVLPKLHTHAGPPVWVGTSADFLAKWRDNPYGSPFVEAGRWTVVSERKHRTAEEVLRAEIHRAGIGRDLDVSAMRVLGHEETLATANGMLLTRLMRPQMPWER